MKLAFITESGHKGKISPQEPNQRVDLVWQIALQTDHIPWNDVALNPSVLSSYDASIIIIPKNSPQVLPLARQLAKDHNIIIMQEGPCLYWQEWPPKWQVEYYELLQEVSGVFVHGSTEIRYFQGLTNKPVRILPTMVNMDYFNSIPKQQKEKGSLLVGGNACIWYNGTSSAGVTKNYPKITKVYFPSMGRKQTNEEILMSIVTNKEVEYLPYMNWTEFIKEISKIEYAIHLMPSAAAGTFNLNCALLGIPCIGNQKTDTQRVCFPDLSIDVTDLEKAQSLLYQLTNNEEFKNQVIKNAKENAQYYFSVKKNLPLILKNIQEVINHGSKK